MIFEWLRKNGGDTEKTAQWMRNSLHIGGIVECRNLIADAVADINMGDCNRCFASQATMSIIDMIHPITGKTLCFGKTLAETKQEYPDAQEMEVDIFCEWKAERQRTPITWEETTESRYWEMLEVLPPEKMLSGAFLVGEPMDHDAGSGKPRFEAFRQDGEKFYKASRPMTLSEFRDEMQKHKNKAA